MWYNWQVGAFTLKFNSTPLRISWHLGILPVHDINLILRGLLKTLQSKLPNKSGCRNKLLKSFGICFIFFRND